MRVTDKGVQRSGRTSQNSHCHIVWMYIPLDVYYLSVQFQGIIKICLLYSNIQAEYVWRFH